MQRSPRLDVRKTEIVPNVTRSTPGPSEAPWQRASLQTTPGRCANLDYCSIGMQRILVEVPVNKPFICPECGGKLRPPVGWRSAPPLGDPGPSARHPAGGQSALAPCRAISWGACSRR